MIKRYELPAISQYFSDKARYQMWLEVELLATEASAEQGIVPREDAKYARKNAPTIDDDFIDAVLAREEITNHDVAAFVDVVQDRIGGTAGKWIHYGLTSSDVVDTAFCANITRAVDELIVATNSLIAVTKKQAENYRDTPMIGRTHGIHAEPTTFGVKMALWALQLDRDWNRLQQARKQIAVGKLSGAVGTYSNIDPAIEEYVCDKLGLSPVPSTQVIARDRHAEVMYACTSLGTTIETIATEIRHLQRTEVSEVQEPFGKGQKGSSAMPHKRNPIIAERLSGLARILRGNLSAALENVALWHERDISHSSVERMIIPDSIMLTYYMTTKLETLLDGLTVNADRMIENLESTQGVVFSQSILLALVESGLSRDDAYRIVQRNALKAFDERIPLRTLLEKDPDVALSSEQLDEAFDLKRVLANTDRVFEAIKKF